jgi:hypothetical protein
MVASVIDAYLRYSVDKKFEINQCRYPTYTILADADLPFNYLVASVVDTCLRYSVDKNFLLANADAKVFKPMVNIKSINYHPLTSSTIS